MKQKGLAPILIVILIAALAIGGYLIYSQRTKPTPLLLQITQPIPTPTPTSYPKLTNSTDTASWKTYASKKYGYSFQYPTNLEIAPDGYTSASFLSSITSLNSPDYSPYNGPRYPIKGEQYLFGVIDDTDLIKDLITNQAKSLKNNQVVLTGLSNLQEDYGYIATNSASVSGDTIKVQIYPKANPHFYGYKLSCTSDKLDNCKDTFGQILSSFKIKPTQNPNFYLTDLSSWDKYILTQNTTLHLSILITGILILLVLVIRCRSIFPAVRILLTLSLLLVLTIIQLVSPQNR